MSWFGLGGGSDNGKKTEERSMKIDDFDSSSAAQFDNTNQFSHAPSAGGGSFEQEVAIEQQKAMIQAVMFKLTEASFDACVTKPSSSLSYGEKSCISAVVGKYLDTSELIVAKMQGGQH